MVLAGFSNFNSIGATIKAEYIVINGIRVDKDYENFVPETFGRLTTIGPVFWLPVGVQGKRRQFQVCQCSCGSLGVHRKDQLQGSHTISCGCFNRESVSKAAVKHGDSILRTPEYVCWENIKRRCRQDTGKYSPKGIRVCDRWLDPENGYANFLADMGRKPSPELTIERKHNTGDYCPDNCEWADMQTQARNKSSNIVVEAFGISMILADWSKFTGLPYNTLKSRLKQLGWTAEKALSTPTKNTPNPRLPKT